MNGRKQTTHNTSAGPRSVRGPPGLSLFAVAATMAVVAVKTGPPAASPAPRVQAERSASPVRDLATPPPALEIDLGDGSLLEAFTNAIQPGTDPTFREECFALLVDRLEGGDFPATMARIYLPPPGPSGEQLGARVMRRWAEDDIQAASRWAAASPDGLLRPVVLEQVALVWAGRDLARAAEWARSLKPETERDEALRMIAHEAVRTEPATALAMAVELPAGEPRDQLVLRAASEWASKNPAGAVAWARQIPDRTLRDEVLAGVAMAWGDSDPVAAAMLAASELPPGRLQSDAVVAIVQRWAQTNPQAAARWVAQFPESPLREAALENLSLLWAGELLDGAPGS